MRPQNAQTHRQKTTCLLHLGVDVEARVAELRDLLREELHAVHRVAEDDGLVDLQLSICQKKGLRVVCEIGVLGGGVGQIDRSTTATRMETPHALAR